MKLEIYNYPNVMLGLYVIIILLITMLSFQQGFGEGMKKICKDKKIFLHSETGYFCAYENPMDKFWGFEFVLPDEDNILKID
jgi:hypothetical protein|tara:strand:+ start:1901 stop:2146 length:246 start_codon:yes stop_codon:yes gene_type:complete